MHTSGDSSNLGLTFEKTPKGWKIIISGFIPLMNIRPDPETWVCYLTVDPSQEYLENMMSNAKSIVIIAIDGNSLVPDAIIILTDQPITEQTSIFNSNLAAVLEIMTFYGLECTIGFPGYARGFVSTRRALSEAMQQCKRRRVPGCHLGFSKPI